MKRIFIFTILAASLVFTGCSKDDNSQDPVTEDPGNNNPDPGSNTPAPDPVPTEYDGYTLLWHDEFNGQLLDMTKWNYEVGTGINGDFGTGQLDRATDRPENVRIETGMGETDAALSITTRKETYMDRQYTSGRINTRNKFSCGPGTRIEARVWARDVRYKGQGFAFWLMPAEKPDDQPDIMWPQGGEIDVMEYVGAIPYANLGTVHYAWFWEDNQYQDWNHGHMGAYYNYEQQEVPEINPGYGGWPIAEGTPNTGSGGYHLYRIDWYDNRIEFSVDGNIYHINYFNDGDAFSDTPDGQDASAKTEVDGKRVYLSEYSHHFDEWHPFSHKFYLILSAGVGGNDNITYGGAITPEAEFPCSTFIDYVRVYQRN